MTSPQVTAQNINQYAYSDSINRRYWDTRYTQVNFKTNCVTAAVGGGAASGTAGNANVLCTDQNATFEWNVIGTQTITAPSINADGLDISQDQTASDGGEWSRGVTANCPDLFTVGSDDPFYLQVTFKVTDTSGCNPLIVGWRKQAAFNATLSSYTDFAAIGIVGTAGDIQTETQVGSGGVVTTDTTQNWNDGETHSLRVMVDGSGVVTYAIDGSTPVTVVAYTFTSGLALIPFIRFTQAADISGAVSWIQYVAGFQE